MIRANRYKLPWFLAVGVLIFAALACGEPPAPARVAGDLPDVGESVQPRGHRRLEIAVTTPRGDDYDAAMAQVKSLGAQSVPLSIFWDEIETAPGEFQPDPNWLAVANAYYPAQKMEISLTLSVLDTLSDRRPPDLRARSWDDPQVIARFLALLDYVAGQLPDARLNVLAIGNEIDGVLGSDAAAWQAYTRFFVAGAAHARRLWPEVPIGAKVMFHGARTYPAYIRPLWQASDAVMLTYYPLKDDFTVRPPDVVGADFAEMVSLAAQKPLYLPFYLMEVGYPSSEGCHSSLEQQAEFIHQVWQAWDAHAEQIPFLSFTWLSDLPPDAVREFQGYYGVKQPAFGEYLRTLGLRTWEDSPKPAFAQLQAESAARGW